MIRVGIVGTNTSHAGVYAGLLNGRDDSPPVVEGARATAVWSSGKEGLSGLHSDAPDLARKYGIEQVCSDPVELVGSVDLALILDDNGGGSLHPELARPFLEAGVPTYVDKPMALDVESAEGLFDLAERHQTPLMSCSALRFADEFSAVRSGDLGDLSTVFCVGPGDWYNYGVHTVEAAVALIGFGAESVQQLHSSDRDVTVASHADGPRIVIGTLRDAHPPFHITAYGERGVFETDVSGFSGFYTNTIRAAVRMAETGTSQVPREATIEVLAILAAGQRSARTGAPVRLGEVVSGGPR